MGKVWINSFFGHDLQPGFRKKRSCSVPDIQELAESSKPKLNDTLTTSEDCVVDFANSSMLNLSTIEKPTISRQVSRGRSFMSKLLKKPPTDDPLKSDDSIVLTS
eukprot:Pgem_evm1s14871